MPTEIKDLEIRGPSTNHIFKTTQMETTEINANAQENKCNLSEVNAFSVLLMWQLTLWFNKK